MLVVQLVIKDRSLYTNGAVLTTKYYLDIKLKHQRNLLHSCYLKQVRSE